MAVVGVVGVAGVHDGPAERGVCTLWRCACATCVGHEAKQVALRPAIVWRAHELRRLGCMGYGVVHPPLPTQGIGTPYFLPRMVHKVQDELHSAKGVSGSVWRVSAVVLPDSLQMSKKCWAVCHAREG